MRRAIASLLVATTSTLVGASNVTQAAVINTEVVFSTVTTDAVNSTVTLTQVLPTITVVPSSWNLKFCEWIEGNCESEHIEMNICKAIPHYETRGDMGSRMSKMGDGVDDITCYAYRYANCGTAQEIDAIKIGTPTDLLSGNTDNGEIVFQAYRCYW